MRILPDKTKMKEPLKQSPLLFQALNQLRPSVKKLNREKITIMTGIRKTLDMT